MTMTVHDEPDFIRVVSLLDALESAYRELGLSQLAAGLLGHAECELTGWGQHPPLRVDLVELDGDQRTDPLEEIQTLLSRLLVNSTDLASTLRVTRARDLVLAAVAS